MTAVAPVVIDCDGLWVGWTGLDNFNTGYSFSELQWNLDLRKILGVSKIFLKSRFFLISNTRKSLITYINNSKLSILFR